MGSSIHEIRRLVEEFGASRTYNYLHFPSFGFSSTFAYENLGLARTIHAGDLPYPSMTALEIAQYLGATHLESVLAPVIYHVVPNSVLSRLQERFHGLVREDLGRRAAKSLRLPELEVLGELRVPLMWFPMRKSQGGEGARVCIVLASCFGAFLGVAGRLSTESSCLRRMLLIFV
jgi:hypothetical protein